MSQSYNQILKRNQQFQEAHFKLKGFGNGLFSDVILHDQVKTFKYPLMFMEDLPSPMTPGVETFVFRVHFMATVAQLKDRGPDDTIGSNLNEVKSDMRQCAKDFLAFWVQDRIYPELDIEKGTTPTFFEDETADRLTGCYIDVTFRQAFDYNVCAIPVEGVPPPPVEGCDPATYKNSDDSFIQSIDSGATFVAPDVVMTINGIPQTAIPANKAATFTVPSSPAGNEVNGDAKIDIAGGTTKNFDIKYANGDSVIITQDSDSPTLFEGKIPNIAVISSLLVSNMQDVSFLAGDDGDRFINGSYASVNLAALTDPYTLLLDNEWGHKKRTTGDTGGYMDELTGLFYDVNGVLTTKILAFPNEIQRDYAFRRRWYQRRSGARPWADCITLAQTEVKGGETGWFNAAQFEYDMITISSVNQPTYIDSRLFNFPGNTMWSSTTEVKVNTTRAFQLLGSTAAWFNQGKTINGSTAYVKLF